MIRELSGGFNFGSLIKTQNHKSNRLTTSEKYFHQIMISIAISIILAISVSDICQGLYKTKIEMICNNEKEIVIFCNINKLITKGFKF